jgi:hypothetical protein
MSADGADFFRSTAEWALMRLAGITGDDKIAMIA